MDTRIAKTESEWIFDATTGACMSKRECALSIHYTQSFSAARLEDTVRKEIVSILDFVGDEIVLPFRNKKCKMESSSKSRVLSVISTVLLFSITTAFQSNALLATVEKTIRNYLAA